MSVKTKSALALLLAAGASALAMPVWADEAAAAGDGATAVDEVIVTARRRAESEQKAAMALTVIGGGDLDRRNIETVNDLENAVPNMEVDSQFGGGQPQFRIRGIGAREYSSNNASTVGSYVDEVAHPSTVTTHGALFDIDSGACVGGPCAGAALRPWPVVLADGWIRTA